jgi:hypothetical protein
VRYADKRVTWNWLSQEIKMSGYDEDIAAFQVAWSHAERLKPLAQKADAFVKPVRSATNWVEWHYEVVTFPFPFPRERPPRTQVFSSVEECEAGLRLLSKNAAGRNFFVAVVFWGGRTLALFGLFFVASYFWTFIVLGLAFVWKFVLPCLSSPSYLSSLALAWLPFSKWPQATSYD